MANEMQVLLDEVARLNARIHTLSYPDKNAPAVVAISYNMIHQMCKEIDTKLAQLTALSGR